MRRVDVDSDLSAPVRADFDLAHTPWVPVRAPGRVHELLGLRALFAGAHLFEDVEVPQAPAAAGLWRILYLLAARVSGLDGCTDPAGFDARRAALLAAGRFDPGRVDDYFGRYHDRFGLFDRHRPWMQDPRLVSECKGSSGINKLVLGRPSGNNQVWFGHHRDAVQVPVSAAEAVLHLLAALYYGPSGRCTVRTVGTVSEGNMMAGPLRGGLSVHPVGPDLFTSLVAGIPYPGGGPGLAPWEQPGLPDPLAAPATEGLGWLLTGRGQHAVLLTPDATGACEVAGATLTWALRERQPGVRDPYLAYVRNKAGDVYPLPALTGRAPWRDLAVALPPDVPGPGHLRPAVFTSAGTLPAEVACRLRVRVFGFEQDGQTRDKGFFTRLVPGLHLGQLAEHDPAAAAGARTAAVEATRAAGRLGYALARVNAELVGAAGKPAAGKKKPADPPWVTVAGELFWREAERLFLTGIGMDPGADAAGVFTELAGGVYTTVAGRANGAGRCRVTAALARNRWRVHPRRGTATAADDTEEGT